MTLKRLMFCMLLGLLISCSVQVNVNAKENTDQDTIEEEKKDAKYTKSDLRLLSSLIYCEARGESYAGKLAVGMVVMNRKRSSSFPNSVRGVIYQRSQFGPVRNGSLKKALAEYDAGRFTSAVEKQTIKAAKEALEGTRTVIKDGTKKNFGRYLFFSGRLSNHKITLGHHQFK